MTKVKSYRKVKIVQLRVRLCNLPIKRKDTDTKIKIQIVRNMEKITVRCWCLHLEPTTRTRLKKKQEYYPFNINITNIRETHPEERSIYSAKSGNTLEEKKLHYIIMTEKSK